MKVIKTNISDVVILEPRVFGDERGYFFESFSQREFNEQVAEVIIMLVMMKVGKSLGKRRYRV